MTTSLRADLETQILKTKEQKREIDELTVFHGLPSPLPDITTTISGKFEERLAEVINATIQTTETPQQFLSKTRIIRRFRVDLYDFPQLAGSRENCLGLPTSRNDLGRSSSDLLNGPNSMLDTAASENENTPMNFSVKSCTSSMSSAECLSSIESRPMASAVSPVHTPVKSVEVEINLNWSLDFVLSVIGLRLGVSPHYLTILDGSSTLALSRTNEPRPNKLLRLNEGITMNSSGKALEVSEPFIVWSHRNLVQELLIGTFSSQKCYGYLEIAKNFFNQEPDCQPPTLSAVLLPRSVKIFRDYGAWNGMIYVFDSDSASIVGAVFIDLSECKKTESFLGKYPKITINDIILQALNRLAKDEELTNRLAQSFDMWSAKSELVAVNSTILRRFKSDDDYSRLLEVFRNQSLMIRLQLRPTRPEAAGSLKSSVLKQTIEGPSISMNHSKSKNETVSGYPSVTNHWYTVFQMVADFFHVDKDKQPFGQPLVMAIGAGETLNDVVKRLPVSSVVSQDVSFHPIFRRTHDNHFDISEQKLVLSDPVTRSEIAILHHTIQRRNLISHHSAGLRNARRKNLTLNKSNV